MKSLAYEAMMFAREKHQGQVRKYTGEPYFNHLAEVVAISMSVGWHAAIIHPDRFMAVAWLHDVVEDTDALFCQLDAVFGEEVGDGVFYLTDTEKGNRKTRKELSRNRLAGAPGWVQTIKCADIISNCSTIEKLDPDFAKIYLPEKILLLDVMDKADERLRGMAYEVCKNN